MLPRVTLFTRPGCTLCDSVKFIIRKHPLEYVEVDISQAGQGRWLAAYTNDIPVVHVQDSEVARHRLSEATLIRALTAADRHRAQRGTAQQGSAVSELSV